MRTFLLKVIVAEGCAHGFPDINLISKRASKSASVVKRTKNELTPVNAFTCSGTLTGLVLGVDVRTETDSRNQFPAVSLWRWVDSDDDEGYVVVPGTTRAVRLTPANFSSNGVFHYSLDPPLVFEAYDILVWEQPKDWKSVVRMYTIERTDYPSSDDTRHSSSVPLLYPVTSTGKGEVVYMCTLFHD